jgi:putative chitinase
MIMRIADQQLRQMFPNAGRRLDPHLPYIAPAMAAAAIDTPERIAAFLAQLAHESAEYRYMEEIADGSAYEGDTDLGNTEPGDGVKFKGHGPIQITGRANHAACGAALGIDLITEPRLICTPVYGTASACWFWNSRKLSLLADRGWFREITRHVNGGYNGLTDRVAYWQRNRVLLGLPPVDVSNDYAVEKAAIMAFQSSRGLQTDGDVGPMTMAALAA